MGIFRTIVLFILIVIGVHSTAQTDSIFAVVSGDTVTLWQTGAWRNCGAIYRMDIEGTDYAIDWYQADTGDAAFCMCYFDLSVTFQVAEPGYYLVNVYYTESINPEQPIYQGWTYFVIGNSYKSGGVISQYQSECYQNVGINEGSESGQLFNLFPVPVSGGKFVYLEGFPTGGETILEIFTLTGICIYSKHYEGDQPIHDRWEKDELFPVAGIYLARLKTPDKVFTKKITVQ